MSRTIKFALAILFLLLAGSLVFSFYVLQEKEKVVISKKDIEGQLKETKTREAQANDKIKKLQEDIQKTGEEKIKLNEDLAKAQTQLENLLTQVNDITKERDDWKGRVEGAQKERDELLAKLDDLQKKQEETQARKVSGTAKTEAVPAGEDEGYWAGILRAKAELEVEIGKLKEELSQNVIAAVELKQKNADLQLALEDITKSKEEIEREVKYKEDTISNLSLELARNKNDKKYIAEKLEKLAQENNELRGDIKEILTKKSTLEKNIVQLTEDKNKIEGKLDQTENLIQSKIDEIWQIKETLDKSFSPSKDKNTVELPPIVVNSNEDDLENSLDDSSPSLPTGLNAKIIKVDAENNFVVLDVGEKNGVRVGDLLNAYRGDQYLAQLEVIQVRKDICAADIKNQQTKLEVGDAIR